MSVNTANAQFPGNFQGSTVIGQAVHYYDSKPKECPRLWEWLSPYAHNAKHSELVEKIADGTTTWFLEHDLVRSWMAGEVDCLWLKGPMCCGKSVLTKNMVGKNIVQDKLTLFLRSALARYLSDTYDSFGMAFWYCDFACRDTLDPIFILRGMLRQLTLTCKGNPKLPDIRRELREDYYNQHISLEWENVKRLILKLSEHQKVFLAVDGLDECPEESRLTLMRWLLKIQESSNMAVKVFLSSRELPEIETLMQNAPTVISTHQEETHILGDIRTYISQSLMNMTVDQDLKDEIEQKIMSSQPLFRLVDCQMRLLRDCVSKEAIQQTLGDLPLKMYQEYERVLKAIHAQTCSSQTKQTTRYARKILLWLTTATRPLLVGELSDAASIGETLSEASFGRPIRNTAAFLKTCGSFITVKPTGHIALAHLSVKEFFLSKKLRQSTYAAFHVSRLQAERRLSMLTLRYLLRNEFGQQPPQEPGEACRENPLLEYCVLHWTTHVGNFMAEVDKKFRGQYMIKAAAATSPPARYPGFWSWVLNRPSRDWSTKAPSRNVENELLRQDDELYGMIKALIAGSSHSRATFLRTRHHLMVLNGSSPFDQYDPDLSPIFYPVYTGNFRLCRRMLREKPDLADAAMPQVGSPLMMAVEKNDVSMIALLADDFGAKLDETRDLRRWTGIQPLHVAVHLGHEEAFDALLERGATIAEGALILHSAARQGRVSMTTKLIKKLCVSLETRDSQGWTPWFHAIHARCKGMIRTLVGGGCDVAAESNSGQTGLEVAMEADDEEIVRHVVDCIMEVNATWPVSLKRLGPVWTARIAAWNPSFAAMMVPDSNGRGGGAGNRGWKTFVTGAVGQVTSQVAVG